MKTITPYKALSDKQFAIVDAKNDRTYDLYRTGDEAERICADLNRRYGEDAYYAAAIDFGRP